MDLFAAIETERRQLADLLDGLSDEAWTASSCCDGWTVEDVVAHLTVVWNYSAADYVKGALKTPSTWFRPRRALDALNDRSKDERKALGRQALITDIRAHTADRSTPTGFGPEAPLGDLVIHIRDICVPLGITSPSPAIHAEPALAAAISPKFALFSKRSKLKGLAFNATDIDWASGTGPDVNGPALPLAHAMWGRAAALDELTGDGVDMLRQRLAD